MHPPYHFTLFLSAFILTASGAKQLHAAVTSAATEGGRLPEVTASAAGAGVEKGFSQPGTYGNPGWTKQRRFPTTRVFVQRDPWEVGVEQWWRGRTFDGKPSKHLFTEEIEIGLPYRVQLDFYYHWVHENRQTSFRDVSLEARWALADWDVLPLNPTIYGEYKWTDADYGPDVLELKLLLGDDLGDDWQYGVNFVWEQELGGEKTTEWQVTGGLSFNVSETLSVGFETRYIHETVAGARNDPAHKFLIGPSAQFRLTPHTHLDLVGLIGVTKEAPNLEAWVVFGIDLDFGRPSEAKKVRQPVSGSRN